LSKDELTTVLYALRRAAEAWVADGDEAVKVMEETEGVHDAMAVWVTAAQVAEVSADRGAAAMALLRRMSEHVRAEGVDE
jgi:hypothetical protein